LWLKTSSKLYSRQFGFHPYLHSAFTSSFALWWEETMATIDILYPAIAVFSLLVVGLVLTVLEFVKISKKKSNKKQ
jgi:hypothetical protein